MGVVSTAAVVSLSNLNFERVNSVDVNFQSDLPLRPPLRRRLSTPRPTPVTIPSFSSPPSSVPGLRRRLSFESKLSSARAALQMFSENPIVGDVAATAFTGGIALSLLRFWGKIAKMGLIDQKLSRKLVHISVGLVFVLCWPMFRSDYRGAVLAALVPGANIIKMLLLGLGIWKDEATVRSMTRSGDHRELLKGPLYYATTITLACAIYWRTSPIAIAAICNLCAGDGTADIVGRRFGHKKLPHNTNKSVAGSISMACAGFLASIGFMHYLSSFGYVEESWQMVFKFLIVSVAAALVESHPLSTEIDDNLTVPLTCVLVGTLIF